MTSSSINSSGGSQSPGYFEAFFDWQYPNLWQAYLSWPINRWIPGNLQLLYRLPKDGRPGVLPNRAARRTFVSTVILPNILADWKVRASLPCKSDAVFRPLISFPLNLIVPDLIGIAPDIILNRVVLPAPLGADQSQDIARFNLQIDVRDRSQPANLFTDLPAFENCHCFLPGLLSISVWIVRWCHWVKRWSLLPIPGRMTACSNKGIWKSAFLPDRRKWRLRWLARKDCRLSKNSH